MENTAFECFMTRVRKYESKKVKIAKIEIEDFGNLEFVRPSEEVQLDYLNDTMEASTVDSITKEVKSVNLKLAAKAASKFIYLSCPEMQKKESRDQFLNTEPTEIPIEIFGSMKVIDIAGEISTKFGVTSTKEEIAEEIKN